LDGHGIFVKQMIYDLAGCGQPPRSSDLRARGTARRSGLSTSSESFFRFGPQRSFRFPVDACWLVPVPLTPPGANRIKTLIKVYQSKFYFSSGRCSIKMGDRKAEQLPVKELT
jgi:hypothetical protein